MISKYEKKCWACGSNHLALDDRGVKCHDCGATWCVIPKPSAPVVAPGNILVGVGKTPVKMRAKHPSSSVARQAARARLKASLVQKD